MMDWQSCPVEKLAWIDYREVLLKLFFTPGLFLPLLTLFSIALGWSWRLGSLTISFLSLLVPLAVSTLYSPLATSVLSAWLLHQVPAPSPTTTIPAVAVLVGRGTDIAGATTFVAADRLRQGQASATYVSGDEPSTAQRLLQLGVPSDRVAGDSCARTTWENATFTAAWLRQHHPGAPVLLITDPWQLARASRAFAQQKLAVIPVAATPSLDPHTRNRLALRETAATLLYRLQGRM
jgi:uncharacterized SAM-binding protein YcdF (DUF218 family)